MDALAVRLMILTVLILLGSGICKKFSSRFTDLKCESYDDKFAQFKSCKLNVIGRGVVGTNVYITLLQLPLNNIYINWSFWRRYNGYQPFLYNISGDLCHLLKHPRISFEGLVLSAISSRSNLNHTCPYNHDIIVDNLVFKEEFLQSLPMPQGKYKLQMKFAVKKVWKLQVEIFILINE